MAMGSFLLCMERSVPRVTFFLGLEDGVPMGECELNRVWYSNSSGRAEREDGRVPARASEAHDFSEIGVLKCIFNQFVVPRMRHG